MSDAIDVLGQVLTLDSIHTNEARVDGMEDSHVVNLNLFYRPDPKVDGANENIRSNGKGSIQVGIYVNNILDVSKLTVGSKYRVVLEEVTE